MNLTMDGATASVLVCLIVCGSLIAIVGMAIRYGKDNPK